jgi:hypothetical protein
LRGGLSSFVRESKLSCRLTLASVCMILVFRSPLG